MAYNFTPPELKKVAGLSREELEAELQKLTGKELTRTNQRMQALIERKLAEIGPDHSREVSESNNNYKNSIILRTDQKVKQMTHQSSTDIFDQIRSSNAAASENIPTETPEGFKKGTRLKDHQKIGLTWMLRRESEVPRGGILADDMGLGKTISMIALILAQKNARNKSKEGELRNAFKEYSNIHPTFSTLIVAPKSLIYHWEQEIKEHVEDKLLKTYVYYEKNREQDPKILGKNDVVITTYGLISSELEGGRSNSVFMKIGWERVILDEAQEIKNPETDRAKCCCRIPALYRWALSGTPIQNNLNDLYSLVKFVHFGPFDEKVFWDSQITSDEKQTNDKVNALVKYLALRRTKDQKNPKTGGPLIELVPKKFSIISVNFEGLEKQCYEILSEAYKSRVKNTMDGQNKGRQKGPEDPKLKNLGVLAVILRLRQACVHMSLLKNALDKTDSKEVGGEKISLSEVLPTIDEFEELFEPTYLSAKMTVLLKELDQVVEAGHKCVVVSQWLQPLGIVAYHLKEKKISYTEITGEVSDRQERVNKFNQKNRGPQVMLLSLTAGGVGLNLIGGNHLFLMDLHWNPAREQQASDRIHRIGQEKNVFIHKLVCKDTIETRVLELQEEKMKLADNVFKGADKLSKSESRKLLGI